MSPDFNPQVETLPSDPNAELSQRVRQTAPVATPNASEQSLSDLIEQMNAHPLGGANYQSRPAFSTPTPQPPEQPFAAPEGEIGQLVRQMWVNPLSGGKAAWRDQSINPDQRYQDFIQSHAEAQSSPEEVGNQASRYFGANPDIAQNDYQLQAARVRARNWTEPAHFRAAEAVPGSGTFWQTWSAYEYNRAIKRIEENKAEPQDYDNVAQYERYQQIKENEPLGQAVGRAVRRALPFALETMAGMRLARGLGAAAGIGAGANAGRLAQLGTFVGRTAASTALTPAMWAEAPFQRAAATQTSPTDLKNVLPPLGLAIAQNAILGRIQNRIMRPGGGEIPNLAKAAGGGVLEQQGVDIGGGIYDKLVNEGWKTNTHFGTIGDLLEGKKDKALKNTTVQALTFAGFAAAHGKPGQAVVNAYAKALNYYRSQGLNAQATTRYLQGVTNVIDQAIQANPDITWSELRTAVRGRIPQTGPIADYADSIITAFPEKPTPQRIAEYPATSGDLPYPEEGVLPPQQHAAQPAEAQPTPEPPPVAEEPAKAPEPTPETPPKPEAPPEPAPEPTEKPEERPTGPLELGEAKQRIAFNGGKLNEHDITVGGKSVGTVRLADNGEGLKIDWIGQHGAASGEQSNQLGAGSVRSLLRALAEKYPNAQYVEGLRAGGATKGYHKRVGLPGRKPPVAESRAQEPTAEIPSETPVEPPTAAPAAPIPEPRAQEPAQPEPEQPPEPSVPIHTIDSPAGRLAARLEGDQVKSTFVPNGEEGNPEHLAEMLRQVSERFPTAKSLSLVDPSGQEHVIPLGHEPVNRQAVEDQIAQQLGHEVLTKTERDVIDRMEAGESLADIGKRYGLTKQSVAKWAKKAQAKLGKEKSKAQERAEEGINRILSNIANGKYEGSEAKHAEGMDKDELGRKLTARDIVLNKIEKEYDKLIKEMDKESNHGTTELSPERQAHYISRVTEINEILSGERPATKEALAEIRSKSTPKARGETPVRRGAERGVPESSGLRETTPAVEAGREVAPEPAGRVAEAGGAEKPAAELPGEHPATGGSAPSREQLKAETKAKKDAERAAKAEQRAKLKAEKDATKAEATRLSKLKQQAEAERKSQTAVQSVLRLGGLQPNDAAFHSRYESIQEAREHGIPLQIFREGGRSADQLAQELHTRGELPTADVEDFWKWLEQKQLSRHADTSASDELALHDHYRQLEEQANAEKQEAVRSGHSPSATEEALRAGEADWHSENADAGSEEFGFGANEPGAAEHAAAGEPTRLATPAEHAAAGELSQKFEPVEPPPPNTPNGPFSTAAANKIPLAQQVTLAERAKAVQESAVRMVQGAKDIFYKLTGGIAPKVARLSQAVANQIGIMAGSKTHAKELAADLLDKVMGPLTRTTDRMLAGAVLVEMRLRHMRQYFNDQKQHYFALLNTAGNAQDAKKFRELANEFWQKAQRVGTIIGGKTPDQWATNPLLSEADYQRALNDPEIQGVIDRYQQHVVPELERYFREAVGMDENDPINAPTQIDGLPISLVRYGDAEGNHRTTVFAPGAGNLTAHRARRLGATREATGAAEFGYDIDLGNIIEKNLADRIPLANQAKLYRVMTAEKVSQWQAPGSKAPAEGWERLPDVRPPRGTQEAKQGQTDLWVHPEAYDEVRDALQTDRHAPMVAGAGAAAWAALVSTGEFVSHLKNLGTFLTRPFTKPMDFIRAFKAELYGDRQFADTLIEAARIGALREHGADTGAAPEWLHNRLQVKGYNLDFMEHMSKILTAADRAMRVTASKAFDRMVAHKLVDDTVEGRRDFINQIGNYNKRTQSRLVKFLRDTGLGPFATASFNWWGMGLKQMFLRSGVRANSYQASLRLQAEMLGRLAVIPALTATLNYILWGRADGDENTPLGALKIAKDNKRTYYHDLTALTGLSRGLRSVGLTSFAESQRQAAQQKGLNWKTGTGHGLQDAIVSFTHGANGPMVDFIHKALTGESISGVHVATRAKKGESQAWNNIYHASWGLNPLLENFVKPGVDLARGIAHPREKPGLDKMLNLAGPFAPKSRDTIPARK